MVVEALWLLSFEDGEVVETEFRGERTLDIHAR